MAHKLTFDCWHPEQSGNKIFSWTNVRQTGEIWFADYCPECDKMRRAVACVEVPDPLTPKQERDARLLDEAQF